MPKIPTIGIFSREVIRILRRFIGNSIVKESIINLFGLANRKLLVVFILYKE